ncbi:MAG: hypothetical protein BroJett015_32720 [Chloroflexota bacterium]|nr:MAG: hypothetical protein BroJett015_32720 [Chloroflexota bacterium]
MLVGAGVGDNGMLVEVGVGGSGVCVGVGEAVSGVGEAVAVGKASIVPPPKLSNTVLFALYMNRPM